jgi:hypothetical protein
MTIVLAQPRAIFITIEIAWIGFGVKPICHLTAGLDYSQGTDRRHHRSQVRKDHGMKGCLEKLSRSFGSNCRKYRLSSKCTFSLERLSFLFQFLLGFISFLAGFADGTAGTPWQTRMGAGPGWAG